MSKRVFKVKANPKYHDGEGARWPCSGVKEGDIITIDEDEEYLKDRIDNDGDVYVHDDETTGEFGYVGMDYLEEIVKKKDIVPGQKYKVVSLLWESGKDSTSGAKIGDVVTVTEWDGTDTGWFYRNETTCAEGFIGTKGLAPLDEPEPLAEWERELLEGMAEEKGSFLLELTEQETMALRNGNIFQSIRDKAEALLPKRRITIELTEDEAIRARVMLSGDDTDVGAEAYTKVANAIAAKD
jgi:hypothetical protein